MKFNLLVLAVASASAIKVNADPEDEWITVPPQDVKVSDKDWGHEVQRLGHADWLDGHVKNLTEILAPIPKMPAAEGRVAVADS